MEQKPLCFNIKAPELSNVSIAIEMPWSKRIFTGSYGSIVHQSYGQTNFGPDRSAMTWEVTVISTTWKIFFQTWQICNYLLHRPDSTEHQQIQTQRMHRHPP